MISEGRHGSPGRVRASETIHSILIGPVDLEGDAIALHMITLAERKGMSVLRDAASNSEFKNIINQRMRGDPKRWFHGIASMPVARVRSLSADSDTTLRSAGDRFYCVFDTDMAGLPNHADILATMPRSHDTRNRKQAWRAERPLMLNLMRRQLSTPAQFRAGSLSHVAPTSPPQHGVLER
jgi:hypothetical protein